MMLAQFRDQVSQAWACWTWLDLSVGAMHTNHLVRTSSLTAFVQLT